MYHLANKCPGVRAIKIAKKVEKSDQADFKAKQDLRLFMKGNLPQGRYDTVHRDNRDDKISSGGKHY